jgi:ABC-type glycerol-3-phosphate transport system substrate-binding protein
VKTLRRVMVLAALGALAACGGGGHTGAAPSGATGATTPSTAPGLPVVNRARGVVDRTNQRSEQVDQQIDNMDPQPGS